MKKLITILYMLVFPMLGKAEEYVIACKASNNVEVEGAAMPVSAWTNSVLWLTAESPVLNAGTTNAQWICYAKKCTGNLVQPVLNSQPPTIETNGYKALYMDGTDNRIYTTNFNPLTTLTVSQWAIWDYVGNNWLCSQRGPAADAANHNWQILRYATASTNVIVSFNVQTNDLFYQVGPQPTVGLWYHYVFTVDDSTKSLKTYCNGSLVTSAILPAGLRTVSSNFVVGNSGSSTAFSFHGGLTVPIVFNCILSSNEVYELYSRGPR